MKLLTSDSERRIKIKTLRTVGRAEKLIFAAVVMSVCCTLVRDAAPLLSMLFIGNLLRESKVTDRLVKAAQNEIINTVTIFLGLCVGLKMGMGDNGVHLFLNPKTLGILVLGVAASSSTDSDLQCRRPNRNPTGLGRSKEDCRRRPFQSSRRGRGLYPGE